MLRNSSQFVTYRVLPKHGLVAFADSGSDAVFALVTNICHSYHLGGSFYHTLDALRVIRSIAKQLMHKL